jgi:endoglucanase
MTPAEQANHRLARTITLGVDDAPVEANWTLPHPERYFADCQAAGFTAVRLAVVWTAHIADLPTHHVSDSALDRIASITDAALDAGLAVVLDNHLDPDLMTDPARHRDRLIAIAGQVATRFRNAPPAVVLEPLAEPRAALDAVWNQYAADLISTVRAADPDRTLIVGPPFYNTVMGLEHFRPPDDYNLILSIHQYWPIRFTMQGEQWLSAEPGWQGLGGGGPDDWIGTTWSDTPAEHGELAVGFQRVAQWATERQLPVFLGEFGCTPQADPDSRVAWVRTNRLLAEQHGFSWGWWSFAPHFALYDVVAQRWDERVLAALMDPSLEARR